MHRRRVTGPALVLSALLLLTGCGDAEQQEPLPGERVRVRQVIDGDTIVLGDGRDVRLVGIDTPERDECGYEQARDLLTRLLKARGSTVTVIRAPGQEADRYERLLRYVEVDGADVARKLLSSGWAKARYDSRDGYPEHPREQDYRAVDTRAADRRC